METDVIVTNINRPQKTIQTINALLKANDDIKVILVNNGSICKPKIAPSERITIINLKKNLGQAKAVNVGLKVAKSKYVCFMHNDIVINDKNWINKAVNFLKENKQAGLVDVYGWKMVDGKILRISSLRGHKGTIKLSYNFEEVSRTDEMANIFKNDGFKADERYGRTCCGIWIDILGKGLKLYVIKLEDAEHSINSEKITEKKIGKKSYQKLYVTQKRRRREIRFTKLKEYGLLDEYKIYE